MKRLTNILVRSLTLVVLGGMLTGCHTMVGPDDGRSKGRRDVSADREVNTPEELVHYLNFGVRAEAKTPEAKSLAELVESQTAGRLIAKGQVLKPSLADVLLELSVNQTVFDQSGEFILLDGEVDGTIKRLYDGQLLAHDRLTARGKRELGMDKAVASLGEVLVPKIDNWVDNAIKPGRIPMAASIINVKRARTIDFTPGSRLNAEYAEKFVNHVSALPGVMKCELVGEVPDERLLKFRVIYLKDFVPAGLLNKILATKNDLQLKK
jgi:hypothetical protein